MPAAEVDVCLKCQLKECDGGGPDCAWGEAWASRDEWRAYMGDWRERNRARRRAWEREWRKRNRDKLNARDQERRRNMSDEQRARRNELQRTRYRRKCEERRTNGGDYTD